MGWELGRWIGKGQREFGEVEFGDGNGKGAEGIWGTAFPNTWRLCHSGAMLWLILNMVVGIIIDGEEDDF